MGNQLQRKYGLFTAICMVVGIVIGSGVFFKAQTVLQKTGGNMPMGIIAWVIGGAIMMVCMLTFSFMGQKYERVNGIVDYAESTVGPKYGYLMGWFITIIYYPAMTSVLAWLTARYLLVFLTATGLPLTEGSTPVTGPECMVLALLFMCLSFAINALSPKLAGRLQTSTTVIKLIPLGLMAVVGIIYGIVSGTLTQNFTAPAVFVDGASANPLFAAVCATAFAYEGWIIATSINSEIKNSKKNLPRALVSGGIIIVLVYILYFVGVAGGATSEALINDGAQLAFINIFGNVIGNILNLFIAISCFGTLNGLMLGTCRGMYSIAARGNGPAPKVFAQVDKATDMPTNSSVFALLLCSVWMVYFYTANLYLPQIGISGKPFMFDSTELPIITIYTMYLPIFIQWMRKEKEQSPIRRFVLPVLAMCGSVFMVIACIFSHGLGCFWYLIVFAVVMIIGWLLDLNSKKD